MNKEKKYGLWPKDFVWLEWKRVSGRSIITRLYYCTTSNSSLNIQTKLHDQSCRNENLLFSVGICLFPLSLIGGCGWWGAMVFMKRMAWYYLSCKVIDIMAGYPVCFTVILSIITCSLDLLLLHYFSFSHRETTSVPSVVYFSSWQDVCLHSVFCSSHFFLLS